MESIKLFLETHTWVLIFFKVFVIIIATVLIGKIFKYLHKRKSSKENPYLFKQFVYNILICVVYVIGVTFALSQIPQLDGLASTLLAGSGIFALAISLSAQESLNNIISGLFLSLFKPFEIGDRVTLVNEKVTGNIENITLRHTIIRTFTNTRIVVPNSVISQDVIENSDIINRIASSFLDVTVAYDCDIDKAMSLIVEIISNHPSYVDVRTEEEKESGSVPLVKIFIRELGEHGIHLRANVWTETVNENFKACSEIRLQILKRFRAEGIEIPYNKVDVYMKEKRNFEKDV